MSRILLVTQSTRSIGEFRRRWVRRAFHAYARRYRALVADTVERLARQGEVTVLAARELVDETRLPAGVTARFYDESSFHVDSDALAELSRQLAAGWWPDAAGESALSHRGVWLPEVVSISRGIILRLELAEPLGVVSDVFDETKPERLVVMTDASIPERLSRLRAQRDRLPVSVAAPGFLRARLYALAHRALFPREERIRVQDFLRQPRGEPATPPAGAGRRALLVTCRPRHHFVTDPLVTALAAAGVGTVTVATPTVEPEYRAKIAALARHGARVSYLTDYLPERAARAWLAPRRPALKAAWRRITADARFAARLQWSGIPLERAARPFLRRSMEWSLLAAGLYVEAAFRALEAVRPDLVVITSNRRHAERAVALAAKVLGIPCLLFSGTFVPGRDRSALFDIGDRMLVIGQHLKDRLVADQDIDAGRVSVVGDPRSNAARLLAPARLREEVYRDFDLASDRPLLILVSKYVSLLFSIQEKEALYRTMFEAARRLGDPHVLVKVHPNEDLNRLQEQVREWGCAEARLTKDYDIHRLFGAADAAVMVTSMAGLEAMALGCPVVAVQTVGKDFEGKYMPPYVSAGAALRVDMDRPADLAATLRGLLDDGEAKAELVERGRAFAAGYIHPVDGRLAARVLEVAEDIRAEMTSRHGG